MANVQHSTLTGSLVHEPKHISGASTSDNGKVITPSGSTAGTSVLQLLEGDKIASTGEAADLFLTSDGSDGAAWGTAPDVQPKTVNIQVGTTYTFALTDSAVISSGTIAVTLNNASSIAATVPPNSTVAFPVGTLINLVQLGAGVVTVTAGAGVTVNGEVVSQGQYMSMSILKVATDTWVCLGGTT